MRGHGHRCGGLDCPVCEAAAEARAERHREFDSRADEEYETRRAEDRYERQLYGRGG
jgi:hypothetical protein